MEGELPTRDFIDLLETKSDLNENLKNVKQILVKEEDNDKRAELLDLVEYIEDKIRDLKTSSPTRDDSESPVYDPMSSPDYAPDSTRFQTSPKVESSPGELYSDKLNDIDVLKELKKNVEVIKELQESVGTSKAIDSEEYVEANELLKHIDSKLAKPTSPKLPPSLDLASVIDSSKSSQKKEERKSLGGISLGKKPKPKVVIKRKKKSGKKDNSGKKDKSGGGNLKIIKLRNDTKMDDMSNNSKNNDISIHLIDKKK